MTLLEPILDPAQTIMAARSLNEVLGAAVVVLGTIVGACGVYIVKTLVSKAHVAEKHGEALAAVEKKHGEDLAALEKRYGESLVKLKDEHAEELAAAAADLLKRVDGDHARDREAWQAIAKSLEPLAALADVAEERAKPGRGGR